MDKKQVNTNKHLHINMTYQICNKYSCIITQSYLTYEDTLALVMLQPYANVFFKDLFMDFLAFILDRK